MRCVWKYLIYSTCIFIIVCNTWDIDSLINIVFIRVILRLIFYGFKCDRLSLLLFV